MKTTHHPTEELLFDYAAGTMAEPPAIAVAGHAAWCRECQAQIRNLEQIGGAVLSVAEEAPVADDLLDQVLARLDEPEVGEPRLHVTDETRRIVPSPLWPYIDGDVGSLQWQRRGKGVETARVPLENSNFVARMLRIQPGRAVPVHTHKGTEYTLILCGSYHDGFGRYGAGDLHIADPSLHHQPVADEGEACLCFAVLDAPLRFTGPIARYLNPFIRL